MSFFYCFRIVLAFLAMVCPIRLIAQGGGVGSALEWSAYNDQIGGATTHANATQWGVFANTAGLLKNITSGSNLAVTLSITNAGSQGATTMSAPGAGSPAAVVFSPYIHWNSGSGEAIQIEVGDTVTYAFTGLSPSKRYTFRGASMRGNSTYTNRWTRAEISGAASHLAAHTSNILTSAQQPASLSATQAAWNSGHNLTGEMIGWDEIDPGADGAFSIITTRYSGAYPGGNTETPTVAPYGYGFQALRLEQWTAGTPPPPVAVADSVTLHAGEKIRIKVLQNDTGFITPNTLAITAVPNQSTAVSQADGTILLQASAGAVGSDFLNYQVSGPGGTSNPVMVSVTYATAVKIPVHGLNVPAAPPATSYAVATAFSTLTWSSPTCLASPPGETARLFVCQKGGLLRLIPNVTAASPTAVTFLDLPTLLAGRGETLSTSSEQGLLGLAFHPQYASNGNFYVFYSVSRSGVTYQRISRFTRSTNNANAANPASEFVLLEQVDEASNHNGGDLHFGPDGYLYISVGDEGNQNDSLNNSQTITKDFFAGILRIDVDKKLGNLDPNPHAAVLRDAGVARYAVPADNPFVGATTFNGVAVTPSAVRTEFWAVGMRNPWRMSFDSANGELWVADVGQNAYEEIDVVTKGGNYGWAFREGLHAGPKAAPSGVVAQDPVFEYGHGSGAMQGNSVTGGYVYRGSRISALTGAYLFADYTSGNIWALRRNGATAPTVTRIAGETGIVAFGRDPSNDDVLMADINDNRLIRLVASTPTGAFPATLSETGLFSVVGDLEASPGLIGYDVNVPFWSDYAVKRRWFSIPDGVSQAVWSKDGNWAFPNGMIWVKHFDLEMTRNNPATKRRIETRLLVKNASGAYGVTYRWNEAQTEASLVSDEGLDVDHSVVENGSTRIQRWRYPSRAECLSCHNANAGYALSFNTRQLNRMGQILGNSGKTLDLLAAAGYFSNSLPPAQTLPKHYGASDATVSVEARVRSYLDVNCAYCHRTGGEQGGANWDWRMTQTLAQTGLINGIANNNGGNPLNKLIVPGDLTHSIILNRVAVTNGFNRMPPVGSLETDPNGISLLTEWIGSRLPMARTYQQWRVENFGSENSPQSDPAADPDADGQPNRAEYAAGTDPQSASSFPVSSSVKNGEQITLTFSVPENHVWLIEVSSNLQTWSAWTAPDNTQTKPSPGGPVSVTGPATGDRNYFRVIITAN